MFSFATFSCGAHSKGFSLLFALLSVQAAQRPHESFLDQKVNLSNQNMTKKIVLWTFLFKINPVFYNLKLLKYTKFVGLPFPFYVFEVQTIHMAPLELNFETCGFLALSVKKVPDSWYIPLHWPTLYTFTVNTLKYIPLQYIPLLYIPLQYISF